MKTFTTKFGDKGISTPKYKQVGTNHHKPPDPHRIRIRAGERRKQSKTRRTQKSLQRVTGIKTGQLRTVNETRKDLRPKIADERQGPAVRKKVKGTGAGPGPMNCQTDPPRLSSDTMPTLRRSCLE